MKLNIFENRMSNLFAENRLLKFTVLIIGLSVVWLGWQVDSAVRYQRTILIPSGLDRRVSVTDSYASEDYVRAFVRTISSLAFTYNPATARGQFGELLQYFSPDSFPSAKQSFYSLADTIERTRVSSAFVISHPIAVDTEKQVVTVVGTLRQWVDTSFNDVAEKTYHIDYKIIDGKFMLAGISEMVQPGSVQKADKKTPEQFKPVSVEPDSATAGEGSMK